LKKKYFEAKKNPLEVVFLLLFSIKSKKGKKGIILGDISLLND
jgi:hypothetical protein